MRHEDLEELRSQLATLQRWTDEAPRPERERLREPIASLRQCAVARVLGAATTLEAACVPVLQILCDELGWEVGELGCLDVQTQNLDGVHIWARPPIDASELAAAWKRTGTPGAAPSWQDEVPIWIPDVTVDPGLEPEAQRIGMRGMVHLPVAAHGEILAVLRVFCREVRPRDEDVLAFITDIGGQIGQFLARQAHLERLVASEARKVAILDASPDAVITIDHQGRVVELNSAAETLFGLRRALAVGRALVPLIVPPRLRARALARLAGYRATRRSAWLGRRFDSVAIKDDGREFPVEVVIARTRAEDPPLFTLYVCATGARRSAEQSLRQHQERLRSLMTDLLLTEEHERRRLSIDLHDGLSQTIALAQIKLSALRAQMDQELRPFVDDIARLLDQTDRASRAISFELSPPVLHDLGLEPAVHWLVDNIQTRYGVGITLKDDGRTKPVGQKTRVILFRSIRELLINAAKHARARHITVRLERVLDSLSATVEDDGVGIDPASAPVRGLGLFSIQERLGHVGGSMRIDSAPGRGTRIFLSAPLENGSSTSGVRA